MTLARCVFPPVAIAMLPELSTTNMTWSGPREGLSLLAVIFALTFRMPSLERGASPALRATWRRGTLISFLFFVGVAVEKKDNYLPRARGDASTNTASFPSWERSLQLLDHPPHDVFCMGRAMVRWLRESQDSLKKIDESRLEPQRVASRHAHFPLGSLQLNVCFSK